MQANVDAMLMMRCETSGAGYALYWQKGADGLVVGGGYVSPARKAALEAQGKTGTFADACAGVVLDAGHWSSAALPARVRPPSGASPPRR